MELIEVDPGIYYDVPFATYCNWAAVNNSRLGWLDRSPAHYRANVGIESTKALKLGRFIHAGQLEPATVPKLYAVMPAYERDIDNKTKSGEPSLSKGTTFYRFKRKEFMERNTDKEIIAQEHFDMLLGVLGSIANHAMAARYLQGKAEVSICWRDVDTGVLCKARIDAVDMQTQIGLTDLKSIESAADFSRSMEVYRYHRQFAFYRDGWATLTKHRVPFRVVCVEKKPPYAVRAAAIHPNAINAGREDYKSKLAIVRECLDDGCWPGYDDPEFFDLPERFYAAKPMELIVGGEVVTI